MDTPPLIPSSLNQTVEAGDDYLSDQEGSSEDSTSSWSDLPSPDGGSSEDELEEHEYHEEEFHGILALAQQAKELYDASQQPSDLEDVIAYLRDALTVAPSDDTIRAEVLHDLAQDLYVLWQITGGPETYQAAPDSLDESVKLYRHALRLLTPNLQSRALCRSGLATTLLARFDLSSHIEDLEEAIALYRKALECLPKDHPDHFQTLLDLAGAYRVRFESFGELNDLERARRLDEDALDIRPVGHSDRPAALISLAGDLGARYARTHDVEEPKRAVQLQQEAHQSHPDDEQIVVGLASLLALLYDASHDPAHFDAVVKLCSGTPPPQHPLSRWPFLHVLVDVYCARYKHCQDPRYLDEAIQYCQRLLQAEDEHTHPEQPCISISRALLVKDHHADVDRAADLCAKALLHCSPGSSHRPHLIYTLARTFDVRHEATGSDEDANAALRYYAEAVQNPHDSARHRMRCARDWVTFATRTRRFHAVLDASTSTARLLSHIAHFDDDVEVRARATELAAYLSEVIGTCVAEQTFASPEKAVEIVEDIRETLRTLLLNPTSPPALSGLPRHTSRRLRLLAQGLAQETSLSPLVPSHFPFHTAIQRNDRRRQHFGEEFDALVDELRTVEGFEHFLQPTPFHSLVSDESDGHFAILLPAPTQQCQALVIPADKPAAQHVVLPLSSDEATSLANDFVCASETGAECRYESLLEQVWDGVVRPVVDALHLKPDPGNAKPRIWWSPAGSLASLPLHAAGRRGHDGPRTSAYAVSSYVPTISALRAARRHGTDTARNSGLQFKVLRIGDANLHRCSSAGARWGSMTRGGMPTATVMCLGDGDAKASVHAPAHETRPLSSRPPSVLPCPTHDDKIVRGGHSATLASEELQADDSVRDAYERPGSLNDVASLLLASGTPSIIGTMWGVRCEDSTVARIREELEAADDVSDAYVLDEVVQKMRHEDTPHSQWVSLIHIGY